MAVTFAPPSGSSRAKTVWAFYDGANTWRARVYVDEAGDWRWSSRAPKDAALDGKQGQFRAGPSALRGRLLPHRANPRHWMTEDGRWFLNLNDTAYFLFLGKTHWGDPIGWSAFRTYVTDVVDAGMTSVRAMLASPSGGYVAPRPELGARWEDLLEPPGTARPHLANLQRTDERLRWLLDTYPDLYVQLVVLPLVRRWSKDDESWRAIPEADRQRLLRYVVARFAAYPQIFWLVTNDSHYGSEFPHNDAQAHEVGRSLAAQDRRARHRSGAVHPGPRDRDRQPRTGRLGRAPRGTARLGRASRLPPESRGARSGRHGQPYGASNLPGRPWSGRRPVRGRVVLGRVVLGRSPFLTGPAAGRFEVEWYRCLDGVSARRAPVRGGARREMVSPWVGQDVVARLRRDR